MENAPVLAIPQTALRRLEFLAGEYSGRQTLYPPGGKAVSYNAYCTISRESCERFVKIELYSEIPGIGIESFTAFVTYSARRGCYQMWLFSSSAEEPLHMTGDFRGDELVLISEPWRMPWGLQRLRGTFTPRSDSSFEYLTELWAPDGYTRFRQSAFYRHSFDLDR